MDRPWWERYGATIAPGPELWTSNREAARIYGLNHITAQIGGGLARRPNAITLGGHGGQRGGGNSGYQALALAIHFGAARVILLGYDMQNTGRQTHWHGDHKGLGNPQQKHFPNWIQHFATLGKQAKWVEIVNATRETALLCFPRRSLDECLAEPPSRGP